MRIFLVAGPKQVIELENTVPSYVPAKPMCDRCLGPVDDFQIDSYPRQGITYTARCHGQIDTAFLAQGMLYNLTNLVIGPCFRVRDDGKLDVVREQYRAILRAVLQEPPKYAMGARAFPSGICTCGHARDLHHRHGIEGTADSWFCEGVNVVLDEHRECTCSHFNSEGP